jgi:hypothetical protein
MVDDSSQETDPAPDPNRTKRAPPTIDLEATEVIEEAKAASEVGAAHEAETARESEFEPEEAARESGSVASSSPAARSSISPWVIAPFSGAVAAALVIAVGWMLGWPAVQAPGSQVDPAQLDNVAARLVAVEQKLNKPAGDPTAVARLDTLEKSITSIRGDISSLRAQSEKLASALNDVKSAPRDSAASVDLSGINDRIAQLERVSRTQGAEIAQEGERLADAKSADDTPLRRVVAAALLDVQVRHGDPYVKLLAAAKTLDTDPDALKPLDQFAATGVPNAAALSRELLALVPKLSPSVQEQSNNGGIIDRLQTGAAKLVRIERTDAVGNDRSAVVARATAGALRNDLADARRELKALDPADRAAVQAWLDKADARDAALAASRKFADDAMTALAKPAQ